MGETIRMILFVIGILLVIIFGIIFLGLLASIVIGMAGWLWGSLTMAGLGLALVFIALIILD